MKFDNLINEENECKVEEDIMLNNDDNQLLFIRNNSNLTTDRNRVDLYG